jgi:hypothetical protein
MWNICGRIAWVTICAPEEKTMISKVKFFVLLGVAIWSNLNARPNDLISTILGPRTEEIKSAAEAGNAAAQFQLGEAYRSKSWPDAVIWYRKAAKQGNADAQKMLGTVMLGGATGVKQNPEEGIRWLSLAANQGHARAQIALSDEYATGRNLKQDYAEALKWLNVAEPKDRIYARMKSDELVLKMTPEQIADAKKRAAAFVPTPPAKILPTLKLQGVSGSGAKATAIINGKTFGIGEQAEVKVDDESVRIKCLSIAGSSVTVAVAGESQQRVLEFK